MLVDRSARVWAMRHDDLMAADAVSRRTSEDRSALASEGEVLDGSGFARVIDGVAVIPVVGPLMRSMSKWFWSYEEIARDLKLAREDDRVRAILLDIDSPGGMASGCGDLAAAIRGIDDKPVGAFVGGLCASAAYWIASACPRIVAGSGAVVGSIGAVIEFVDIEPMLERMGARIVRVVSDQSPNKRLDPGSPEGRSELQAIVDSICRDFVSAVAAGRGVEERHVVDHFGQGLVFAGEEARARGMIDAIATRQTIIAELAARDATQAVSAPAAEETPMEWEDLTTARLREHRADIVAEIEQAATGNVQERIDEAIAAERARMAEIDAVAIPGFEELVKTARSEGWSAERLAFEIVKADKARGREYLAAREAADAEADLPADPVHAGDGAAPEARLRADWDRDPELRAEFGDDFAAFEAWHKAQAAGRARVLRAS